jgi:hypothetical protein
MLSCSHDDILTSKTKVPGVMLDFVYIGRITDKVLAFKGITA